MGKRRALPNRGRVLEHLSAQWAVFGKQNWRCGMNQTLRLGCLTRAHQTPQKVLVDIDSRTVAMEVGIAKECVTTHLPNQLALKMDGAGARDPCRAVEAMRAKCQASMSRRARRWR